MSKSLSDTAGVLSVERVLKPRSIAIVGASADPRAFGNFVLQNLERFGYAGAIHLVSRSSQEINGRPCVSSVDALPAGIDLAAYLERHGIRASFSATPHVPGVKTGAALLNRLFDVHADLLVMGAYGHARLQELVLGGATRAILSTMTLPVLMSH